GRLRPQAMASVYLQTIASRELMPENPRLLSSHGNLTLYLRSLNLLLEVLLTYEFKNLVTAN
ncbi:hypothetical protein, partial [Turicimonas muris]|uniref:hypothetical protein n=1 Tax=Turicimonas muris TaxID=1796652 RepID=UPI0025A58063